MKTRLIIILIAAFFSHNLWASDFQIISNVYNSSGMLDECSIRTKFFQLCQEANLECNSEDAADFVGGYYIWKASGGWTGDGAKGKEAKKSSFKIDKENHDDNEELDQQESGGQYDKVKYKPDLIESYCVYKGEWI